MTSSVSKDLLAVFDDVCTSVRRALDASGDWSHLGAAGAHAGQYRHDVVADAAAHAVLERAGVGVLSEESGLLRRAGGVVVVIDPIDGSTNASRGLPWYATSLCAFDADGPCAAMVVNQATGTRYHAARGGGAFRDGRAIRPASTPTLAESLVAVSGRPGPADRPPGWRQYRAYGAAALDLCGVADGTFDAFIDCSVDAHGVWDYAGAFLVCAEAGIAVVDAHGRDLLVLDPLARRTPVTACSAAVLAEALAERRAFG